MLGQRLSNEQAYVGPTKYVAVGPTLNQRLGLVGEWLACYSWVIVQTFNQNPYLICQSNSEAFI